jgi:crossover junction endodeoxyribonuclease RusA
MINLIIPGIPPSLNQWRNMHHYTEAKQKKEWEDIVILEVQRQRKKPPKPIKRSTTTYTYYFPDRRRRDASNFSPKWLEDGLVKAGVLEDDSFENVDLKVRKGGVDKHNPRVEITIEEMVG